MITIYCDGACLGNPGPMGIGVVVARDGEIIREISEGLSEVGTNNTAEMQAIIVGLNAALCLLEENESITVMSDSQLALGLLSGGWRSRLPHLLRLRLKVRAIEKQLNVKYEKCGVDDELFQLADALARNAL